MTRSGQILHSGDCHAALAGAAAWRLLGMLFERPRPGWHAEVEALSREVADVDLRGAAGAAAEAREADYLALFGPGGAISPREVSYRGREDPSAVLASLATFYEQFAFRPEREDPIDHVAVETGFAGYLLLKKAYADARGDREAAETAATGFARFVDSHLRFAAEPLATRLLACGEQAHWALAARALLARTGTAPAQHSGPGEFDAGRAEFECGGLPECGSCGSQPTGGVDPEA